MDEPTFALDRISWLRQPLHLVYSTTALLTLSFAKGMLDGVTIPTLKVFVGMDTGNLVYLALGAAGLQSTYPNIIKPVRCITQLFSAWFGMWTTGLFSNYSGPKRRWVILVQFFLQFLITLLVAILVFVGVFDYEDNQQAFAMIALLSFSLGSQQVSIKVFHVETINVSMITIPMSEIMADPHIYASWSKNPKRNERAEFIVTYFLGVLAGGLCLHYVNSALAILVAAVLKLIVFGAFALMKQSNNPEDYSTWNLL